MRRRRGTDLQVLEAEANPGAATANFLEAMHTRVPVACSFRDAVVATAVVEQAFVSARTDGSWIDLDVGGDDETP